MTHIDDNLPTETKAPALRDRVNISSAVFNAKQRALRVNGWAVSTAGVTSVRILSAEHGLLGEAETGLPRPDVFRNHPEYREANAGWLFETECAEMHEGDKITAQFVTKAGQNLTFSIDLAIVDGIGDPERLTLSDFSYDTDSKILRLEGEVHPEHPIRGLSLDFAGERSERITKAFLPSKNLKFKTGGRVNRYGGFEATVKFLGQGALSEMALCAEHLDRSVTTWPLRFEDLVFDPPKGEITKARFDYANDEITVEGWFRSYDPVTTLDLDIGGREVHAIPTVEEDPALSQSLGFRGPVIAQRFRYKANMSLALSDESLLVEAPVSLSLKLRTETLLTLTAPPSKVSHDFASASLVVFDKRQSLLMVWGQCAAASPPTSVTVRVNGKELASGLRPVLPVADTAEIRSWFIAEDLNIEMTQAHKLELELDFGGVVAPHVINHLPGTMIVRSRGSIEGMPRTKIVERLEKHNFAPRHLPAPVACFVFQGTATSPGGGVSRMLNMMRAFKTAGYSVALIDRTNPWDLGPAATAIKEMSAFCDAHLMVAQQFKSDLMERLPQNVDQTWPHGPGKRRILDYIAKAATEERVSFRGSTSLEKRIDPKFYAQAGALAGALGTDVVVSQFPWSTDIHTILPDGCFGILDTHDIQSARFAAFNKAVQTYGKEAIPDLEIYEAHEEIEQRMLKRAPACIAISAEDKKILDEMVGSRNTVLASMPSSKRFLGSPPESKSILFVGNFYSANNFGIRLFLEAIWPLVVKKVPQASVDIIGRCCETITDLEAPNINLHHRVEDLEPFYANAAVAINPVRFGSGLPIKAIEALGMGKAIMSTSVGARGLSAAVEAGAMRVADDPNDFATEVVTLLEDRSARRNLEKAAFGYAETYLAPEIVYSNLFNFLESRLFYAPR
ncbi:MAG: hypothetical protein EpisKO_40820 [Epibacterium sp.]